MVFVLRVFLLVVCGVSGILNEEKSDSPAPLPLLAGGDSSSPFLRGGSALQRREGGTSLSSSKSQVSFSRQEPLQPNNESNSGPSVISVTRPLDWIQTLPHNPFTFQNTTSFYSFQIAFRAFSDGDEVSKEDGCLVAEVPNNNDRSGFFCGDKAPDYLPLNFTLTAIAVPMNHSFVGWEAYRDSIHFPTDGVEAVVLHLTNAQVTKEQQGLLLVPINHNPSPRGWPVNWRAPLDYHGGEIHMHLQIHSQPSNKSVGLTLCISQDGGCPTCASVCSPARALMLTESEHQFFDVKETSQFIKDSEKINGELTGNVLKDEDFAWVYQLRILNLQYERDVLHATAENLSDLTSQLKDSLRDVFSLPTSSDVDIVKMLPGPLVVLFRLRTDTRSGERITQFEAALQSPDSSIHEYFTIDVEADNVLYIPISMITSRDEGSNSNTDESSRMITSPISRADPTVRIFTEKTDVFFPTPQNDDVRDSRSAFVGNYYDDDEALSPLPDASNPLDLFQLTIWVWGSVFLSLLAFSLLLTLVCLSRKRVKTEDENSSPISCVSDSEHKSAASFDAAGNIHQAKSTSSSSTTVKGKKVYQKNALPVDQQHQAITQMSPSLQSHGTPMTSRSLATFSFGPRTPFQHSRFSSRDGSLDGDAKSNIDVTFAVTDEDYWNEKLSHELVSQIANPFLQAAGFPTKPNRDAASPSFGATDSTSSGNSTANKLSNFSLNNQALPVVNC